MPTLYNAFQEDYIKLEQELAELKEENARLKMLLMEENPELLNAFENPAPKEE